MYVRTESYMAALHQHKRPIILVFIQSLTGQWVYSVDMPRTAQIGYYGGIIVYDGSVTVGEGNLFGSSTIILDRGPFLKSIDGLTQTISPESTNVLASYARQSEITTVSVTLNNTTKHFSTILTDDSFLTKILWIRQGFLSLEYEYFLDLYKGTIFEQTLTEDECRITAESI